MAATASSSIVAFLPAPSGYVVNFDHPQRKGIPMVYWVTGVGLVLATIAITMRIYTRARIVKEFKYEDCKLLTHIGI
jgi:cytochrome c-type biogenesis protein CcmH/NrfF